MALTVTLSAPVALTFQPDGVTFPGAIQSVGVGRSAGPPTLKSFTASVSDQKLIQRLLVALRDGGSGLASVKLSGPPGKGQFELVWHDAWATLQIGGDGMTTAVLTVEKMKPR